jgi:hypothetical protein
MRRMLLSGIVLALGVSPTLAQNGLPTRGASLGRPTAIHEPPAVDPGITPASLLARGQATPSPTPATGVPMPMPGPTPMGTGMQPLQPMGTGSTPMGMQPGGMPVPTPPAGSAGAPSVTEVRTPASGHPYFAPGVPTLVPSVSPDGMVLQHPGAEYPYSGIGLPGCTAIDRVAWCDRWYAGAEMLTWWTRSDSMPPLLTTSAPQFFGIPGRGNTTTVLAGEFMNTFAGGGRFTIGRWFGDSQIRAAEARFFFLGRIDSDFTATSDQYPVLARPFYNVNNPVGPFSQIIASPGLAIGGAVVDFQSSVWGAEANYRRFLFGNPCSRVDAIVGYRYVNIKERLSISESFIRTGRPQIGAPAVAGSVTDVFRTENAFNGGQIGLSATLRYGRWSIDGRATVAFGNLEQTAEISGAQQIVLPNGSITNYAGGLLALPGANIGTHTENVFAVIPEVGVNVGYQLTARLRVFVGYNFLYLANALRPSGAIDRNIDAARIPNFPLPGNPTPLLGIPRPAPQFNTTDYFVQGISFGLQFNW